MSKVIMQLETLTCPTCIKKIEGALSKAEGVDKAKVLFNSSKAKVTFDRNLITADQLKEFVENLGYEVKSTKTA